MTVIKRLSDYVANQIAAGEVVTAPSSVIKELMENAIDAGAEIVIVNIKEGGSDLIQIVDNGCGMSFEDAITCFERHTTSKISDINDIYKLNTYGFRGEALASIASVAEVELLTRREEDELGTRVVIEGGDIKDHSHASCAVGTQLIIKNLFYNIPARRNFLKSKRVETTAIINEFNRVALSYPKITFCIYDNDQKLYNFPASNLRYRVSNVIGKQSNGSLMELYIDNQIVEIRGYIGKPDSAKKSSPHFMFINGRYFYKSYFNKAIQLAYEKLIPPNNKSLPPYILYFSINPARIDVNVSPSKTEVKFDDEQSVFQILKLAVKESLGKNGIVPMIDFDAGSPIDIPLFNENDIKEPELDVNPYFNPFDENFSFSIAIQNEDSSFRSSISNDNPTITDSRADAIESFYNNSDEELYDVDLTSVDNSFYNPGEDNFKNLILPSTNNPVFSDIEIENTDFIDIEIPDSHLSTNSFEEQEFQDVDISIDIDIDLEKIEENETYEDIDELTLNGTPDKIEIKSTTRFLDKYLIVTTANSILLINIKRASWRVMCDRLMNELDVKQQLDCQKILFAIDIELSPKHYYDAIHMKELFNSLGFQYDTIGNNTVSISGVPADGAVADTELLFEELLDSINDDLNGFMNKKHENFIARISHVASSVKRRMSDDECKYMVEQLLLSSNARYTPNGKSIFILIEENEIDKMLK